MQFSADVNLIGLPSNRVKPSNGRLRLQHSTLLVLTSLRQLQPTPIANRHRGLQNGLPTPSWRDAPTHLPALEAYIFEQDETPLSDDTAKQWSYIGARFPKQQSWHVPVLLLLGGLCTGRFSKSLARLTVRADGLQTVD